MSKLKTALSTLLSTLLLMCLITTGGHAAERLTVFAAASLKNALDDVSKAWDAESGNATTISYAGSSALAKQIEEGAPADVFVSADLDWMKRLSDKSLIKPGSDTPLLGNSIVLVAPKTSAKEIAIAPNFDLAGALGEGKLAMANVDAVPAGKYGKAALESLGVWTSVKDKVAQAENVRAALKLVAMGEAALGIVYLTDAAAEPAVAVVGNLPAGSHPPIVYPVGIVAASKSPVAESYVKFLRSEKAKVIFQSQGFTVIVSTASN